MPAQRSRVWAMWTVTGSMTSSSGARYQAAGGPYAGAAYLVYGKELQDGGTLGLGSVGVKFVGERFHDNAGAAVSSAGDIDGDGLADLLIGSYRNDTQAEDAGAVYVFRGASIGEEAVVDVSEADVVLLGESQDDNAGFSLAAAGDIDGDGLGDVVVGARYSASGGLYAGAAYVVLGSQLAASGAWVLSDASCKLVGEESSDYAGLAVASAGDLTGDGRAEVLVGAPGHDRGALDAGAIYGLWAEQVVDCGQLDLSEAGFVLLGEATGDSAGLAMERLGDVDADSVAEILVGVERHDPSATDAGAVYVVSGAELREGGAFSLGGALHRWSGELASDGAGLSIAGVQNASGRVTAIIGAPGDDSVGENSGSAYFIDSQ